MLYIPIPDLSVINVGIEFLVSCRKPLNLSMRGMVCGEECRGYPGHPYVSTTYVKCFQEVEHSICTQGSGVAALNHSGVINHCHQGLLRRPLGSKRDKCTSGVHRRCLGYKWISAYIVACLGTQIVPINAPTHFTYFGHLWMRTTTGLPFLLMVPVVISHKLHRDMATASQITCQTTIGIYKAITYTCLCFIKCSAMAVSSHSCTDLNRFFDFRL